MAHLDHSQSGLMPTWEPPKSKPREKSPLHIPICETCGGQVAHKRRAVMTMGTLVDGQCLHCLKMFGGGFDLLARGVTNISPEAAIARIEKIREAQWVMILRRGNFMLPDGRSITVEPGDMFKCARAGSVSGDGEFCSWARTKAMFSVEIGIAGVPLTLWPHECAQISFVSLMQMKQAGEIEEVFLSSDDEQGHFQPNAQLREDIYATFGHLVNAPENEDPLEGRYGPHKDGVSNETDERSHVPAERNARADQSQGRRKARGRKT